MQLKRAICASAITIGLGLSALTAGVGVASAQPGPPPCGPRGDTCQGPSGQGGPRNDGPGGQDNRSGPGGQDNRGGPGGQDNRGPDRGGHGGPDGRQWGPPPPDLAWRGIDQGRYDHQPFNYNGAWVEPAYNQDYNNWGFWFFGIWIPL